MSKTVKVIEVWAVVQPNGAVHVFENRPEVGEDGYWFDDHQHDVLTYPVEIFPATKKPRKVLLTETIPQKGKRK